MVFCCVGKVIIVKNEGTIHFGKAKIIRVSDFSKSYTGAGESTEEEEAISEETAVQTSAKARRGGGSAKYTTKARAKPAASTVPAPFLAPKLQTTNRNKWKKAASRS